MKQVIVFPRGQLSEKDKARLQKADIIAVEADDPSKVVCAVPGVPFITGNDIMCAALDALVNTPSYGSSTGRFAAELAKRALAKDKEAKGG
jgi:hypothetical protein